MVSLEIILIYSGIIALVGFLVALRDGSGRYMYNIIFTIILIIIGIIICNGISYLDQLQDQEQIHTELVKISDKYYNRYIIDNPPITIPISSPVSVESRIEYCSHTNYPSEICKTSAKNIKNTTPKTCTCSCIVD